VEGGAKAESADSHIGSTANGRDAKEARETQDFRVLSGSKNARGPL
jgi:hypothetical protein